MGTARIGVSACLLGRNVRCDGGNKLDSLITETLSRQFELVPVCPEFELGLGAPREPMHLEGGPDQPRLVTNHTRIDLTDHMLEWCLQRVHSLKEENLSAFIFKNRSPSCDPDSGLFARAFAEFFPDIPLIDEVSLLNSDLRDRFIQRASALGVIE